MEVFRSSLTHLGISASSLQPSRRFSIPSTPNTLLPEFGSTRIHGFSTTRIAFSRAYGNSPWRSCPVGAEVRAMGLQLKNEIDGNVRQSKHPDRQGLRRKKLAVFVSGGGSNFRAIHQATLTDDIYGDVVVLITDKPGCGASDYARNSDIPIFVFPKSTSSSGGLSTMDLVTTLRQFEIDFLLLAGYLKLLPVELVQAYPRSILNIHPSLLPAFGGKGYYGIKVHKAVIASGARFSGPTVHFVDEKYDTGQILAQRVVPVLANDSAEDLAARVLQECRSNGEGNGGRDGEGNRGRSWLAQILSFPLDSPNIIQGLDSPSIRNSFPFPLRQLKLMVGASCKDGHQQQDV